MNDINSINLSRKTFFVNVFFFFSLEEFSLNVFFVEDFFINVKPILFFIYIIIVLLVALYKATLKERQCNFLGPVSCTKWPVHSIKPQMKCLRLSLKNLTLKNPSLAPNQCKPIRESFCAFDSRCLIGT